MRGESRRLERLLAGPRDGIGSRLWPDLAVISCWADGPSADPARTLARLFPSTTLEPKGLLATEGVVSIPWGKDRAPTLAPSHLLEFLPLGATTNTVLPDELEPGRDYSPILTTGAGLYRYHLKDIVRCIGPRQVRFIGKLDLVGDLVGEKLDGQHVTELVEAVARRLGLALGTWLITPAPGPIPGYGLLADSATTDLARDLEAALCEGHAYRYARELGQLAPLSAWHLPDLERHLLNEAVAQGQRLGDIKPLRFDPRPRWHALFDRAHATSGAHS